MDPTIKVRRENQAKVRAIPLTVPGADETPLEEPKTVKTDKDGKKCKKNPCKVIFCIIMAILLLTIGVAGGVYVDRQFLLKPAATSEELKPEVGKIDESEDVLTSAEELDLTKKISYYTLTVWDGQPAEAVSIRTDIFDEVLTRFVTNALTDVDKISLTIDSLSAEYEETDSGEAAKVHSLPATRVAQQYMSLFGTEIPALTEGHAFCPGFTYNAEADIYYVGEGCGGVALEHSLLYKESFSLENGVAVAYIRLGAEAYDPDSDQMTFYNDYLASNTKEVYQLGGGESANGFTINSTNFENFARYKVSFVKNANGEYSLDNVSRM